MSSDDAVAYSQAQPGALGLGTDKRFENMFAFVSRHAWSIILDLDCYLVPSQVGMGFDGKLTSITG